MPSITGPKFLSPSEIRTEASVQSHVGVLGNRAETLDGRIFRAARAGASALVAGNLQQSPAVVANHINQVVGDAGAVGDMFINVDLGATLLSADQYADEFIVINDAAGEGIAYRVGGHAAAASAATSVRINITEPLQVALTADTSEYSLVRTFRGTLQTVATTLTGAPVGGADKAYAADNYYWLQTGGAGSVLNGDSAVINQMMMPGTTAGSVLIQTAGNPQVGKTMQAHVSGEHRGIWWLLN